MVRVLLLVKFSVRKLAPSVAFVTSCSGDFLLTNKLLYSGSSKDPSTAFCLLLRLLTLRCSEKQMKLLLDHPDSPYIRAIGFLFLRYAGDPKHVWDWIAPYLYDEEIMQIEASASKQNSGDTIGSFVRRLFTEKNYYGTILPRLPIHIEREIQVKLLQAEKVEERTKKHASNPQTMVHFKRLGSKVMALYGDDENPIQWYEAVVDRVITTNEETLKPLKYPKFVVTFPEYGNTETVTLGEMEMPGSTTELDNEPPSRGGFSDKTLDSGYGGIERRRDDLRYGDRGRGYDNRGYGRRDDRGYDRNDDRDVWNRRNNDSRGYKGRNDDRGRYNPRDYDRGRDGERGRNYEDDRWGRGYTQGGRSTAAALPSEDDLYEEVRRRERETVTSNSRNAISRRPPSTKTSLLAKSGDAPRRSGSHPPRVPPGEKKSPPLRTEIAPVPKKRTAEEIAAIQEKKRRLMAKYG